MRCQATWFFSTPMPGISTSTTSPDFIGPTPAGVPVEISVVSVLAYRAIAFWLPTLPGAFAYLQLRRTVHRWSASAQAPSYT